MYTYINVNFPTPALTACTGMYCSFGLAPAQQLNVPAPLMPNQSNNISLPVSMSGVIQRMDPLTNLQVSFCTCLPVSPSICDACH